MWVDEMRQALIDEVKPIINAMGFELVELKFGLSRNQQHVSIIIYSPEGVGLDNCAAVSKNLHPRLEMIEGLEDLRLEVSSPGLERVIKQRDEYRIFQGRSISICLDDGQGWRGGIISSVTDETLLFKKRGTVLEIRFDDIQKARLDYRQEVDR